MWAWAGEGGRGARAPRAPRAPTWRDVRDQRLEDFEAKPRHGLFQLVLHGAGNHIFAQEDGVELAGGLCGERSAARAPRARPLLASPHRQRRARRPHRVKDPGRDLGVRVGRRVEGVVPRGGREKEGMGGLFSPFFLPNPSHSSYTLSGSTTYWTDTWTVTNTSSAVFDSTRTSSCCTRRDVGASPAKYSRGQARQEKPGDAMRAKRPSWRGGGWEGAVSSGHVRAPPTPHPVPATRPGSATGALAATQAGERGSRR